ncbi:MAG: histidine--tRNA ligase [Myxococcaceae bacterium]
MNDVLSPDVDSWEFLEETARNLFRRFGFHELRTPIVEDTALFVRSVGEETDIVGKEMYTFDDRGGRSLSLRPEGTAPAARAYIEHSILNKEPVTRWFYMGPMFRYERMKTGRYRQFNQIGAEAYGAKEPLQDVEVIDYVMQLLTALGLEGVSLHLNSLGDDKCRPQYQQALVSYLTSHREELCEDCQRRLETNPLRVLDCKNEQCQRVAAGAPSILESLCDECRAHFDEVRKLLEGLGIRYELDPRMVRGLDYYTRTAFEFIASDPVLGTASAVGGGGRYDKLVKSLGGPDVPAVGFGLGMERLVLLLQKSGRSFAKPPDLFVAFADEAQKLDAVKLVSQLRKEGFTIEFDPRGGSLKSQMKRADKTGAKYAVVIGDQELSSLTVQLKPMQGGEPKSVPLQSLAETLRSA